MRRIQTLHLRPISNLTWCASGKWEAIGPNPCFELEPSRNVWPSGWVLLDAVLLRWSADCSARLYFDTGNGFREQESIPVPASYRGIIHEVLYFPPGIRCVRWVPMRSAGFIEQHGFQLTEIGNIEQVYRMLRRVIPALLRYPVAKWKAAGLNLRDLFLDLPKAYAVCSKLRALAPPPSYTEWVGRFDSPMRDIGSIRKIFHRFPVAPHFVVLITGSPKDHPDLARTQASLHEQSYSRFKCHVLTEMALGSVMPEMEHGDFVMVVQAGDVLAEHTLFWMAKIVAKRPEVRLIYVDEDYIDDAGVRSDPIFKPDWSPELLRSTNYIGRSVAIRADVLQKIGLDALNTGDNHLVLLRVTGMLKDEHIVHIPWVLFHRGSRKVVANEKAICDFWMKTGRVTQVEVTRPGCYRLFYRLPPTMPKVSIMIPTRDAPELIRRCVDSILQKSTYQNYEIIIVDNQSSDPSVLAYFDAISKVKRVRLLSYDAAFNFSAINNMAAHHARGEILCLLNNDTEIISPDWMEEMLGHLLQDRVGVVGAKLYYPGGHVQHAGTLIGVGGVARHAHVWLQRDDPGYCNRAVVAQDLSAVTAACMLTWRSLYFDLGGLDEKHLPVAFNDVDYCLRVREAGYRVVWTPHAELYHHESASRSEDVNFKQKHRAKREVAYMRKRWKKALQNDPYYNPNLSHERPDFSLSHAPIVKKLLESDER